MALRRSKIFRVVGYGLAGLALVSALAHIVQRASTGGWNDSYRSAKLVPWTYGAAFILIAFVVLVGVVGLCLFLQRRWRGRAHS
jgi:hypothetical protein